MIAPLPILERTDLTAVHRVILCWIVAAQASGMDPSIADIGRILRGCGDRHKAARRHIRALEQKGVLRRIHTPGKPMRFELLVTHGTKNPPCLTIRSVTG